jgi:hypothetical protein
MNLQQVHLRINDAATGQPTPVRLRITDADGTYYAPFGRLTDFEALLELDAEGNVHIDDKEWCYIDGACEILLPPGKLRMQISKGFEYKLIDEVVTLIAGKMALRFAIERWSDLRKQGWYSGDTRARRLTPDAALLEGQGEDVAVVNLLIQQEKEYYEDGDGYATFPNLLSFSGQRFARQADGYGVAVNTFNYGDAVDTLDNGVNYTLHGMLALLHCHRIVYPLRLGATPGPYPMPEWAESPHHWPLANLCDQCHRKNGLVIWCSPPVFRHNSTHFGEPLADLVLGKIDALEVTGPLPYVAGRYHPFYYDLLNAELPLALAGASGSVNEADLVGQTRTYALLEPDLEFTYSNWIEAVRAGRTFVTNGPLLRVTVDGKPASTAQEIHVTGTPLQIRAEVSSAFALDQLDLLWNGKVIKTERCLPVFPFACSLEAEFMPPGSGWLAACAHGDYFQQFAHTSAVVVRREDSPGWATPEAINPLLQHLDAMLRWAQTVANGITPDERSELCSIYEQARTVLARKLSG